MKLKNLFKPINILDNVKMRHKLLLLYFILIVIPLSFFTFLIYSKISVVMHKQTLNSGTQVYDETVNILNRDFEIAYNALTVITTNQLVYDVMLRTYSEHDLIDEVKDKDDLFNLFLYLRSNTYLEYIHLYTFGDKILIEDNSVITNYKSIEHTEWYKRLDGSGENSMWIIPAINTDQHSEEIDSFSMARIIYDPGDFTQKIGIIKIDISAGRIESVIKNTLITLGCVTYLSENANQIISTSTLFDMLIPDASDLSLLNNKGWEEIKTGNNDSYINVKRINHNNWYLVTLLPVKDVAATAKSLRNEMLLIMLLVSLAAYILAYYISASTVERLSILSNEMKKAESDLTGVLLVKKGNDEIGHLMGDFNYMISKINILVEEKYKLGLEVKNLELKALQAQINPHFLYNSLEMINSTALLNNIPDIAAQVTALSRFYRLSLSQGKEIITIGEELEHIRIYIHIQNMRFQNRISYNIDVQEEVLKYKTLKIILQPIVENSIIHGIFEKDSKSGVISVSVDKMNDSIFINIEDDGIGIPEEKLKNLLNYSIPEEASGYGIKNIDQRIRLYYGQKYGLSFLSKPGAGTKATVHIPAIY